MEISLRKERKGRIILRESDGLIPLCDSCLETLEKGRNRRHWPFFLLAASLVMALSSALAGGILLMAALIPLAAALIGLAYDFMLPGSETLKRRLRKESLTYTSVELPDFEASDLQELLLDRRLRMEFPLGDNCGGIR